MALYYFSEDDNDQGFSWLEKSYERHEVEMTWLQEEPLLSAVKNDPRFLAIYNAMSWPEVN